MPMGTLWRGLIRRITGALRVLLLPGDQMPVTRADLARFEARMVEWEALLASTFDKLSMWSARQAKREQRAAEAALAGQDPAQTPEPSDRRSRKLELYRRAAGGGLMPKPAGVPGPPPSGGDDE